MRQVLLDTSALLTLRDNEPGADQVAELLSRSQQGDTGCFGCFITLMEVFYRVWKDESETAGRLAYEQCLSLPMTWIHETPGLLEKAAGYKARYRLSLADAWIAACAELENAILVHKDPEFEALKLEQLRLPYKT
jgi:predicted nucleic acid-binding protein